MVIGGGGGMYRVAPAPGAGCVSSSAAKQVATPLLSCEDTPPVLLCG